MTNRAKKISELAENVSPSADDLLVIVDTPSGTAVTKKVTVANLLSNSSANVTISNTAVLSAKNIVVRRKETPSSSSTSDQQGTIYFDDNYLYLAISNGAIKRVALSTF
jgi:CxxC motif-containing protein (DUF1111 family)